MIVIYCFAAAAASGSLSRKNITADANCSTTPKITSAIKEWS